jgi:hypothetical protein
MKWIRRFTTAGLLAFVAASLGMAVVDATGLRATPTPPTDPAPPAKAPVVAYYFHSNHRCPTCRTIEANGQAALADAVRDGRVEWRVVNYDEPANRHFAQDYDLAFASLVLLGADGQSPRRWKNLDRVWELHGDPPAFARYVQAELAAFTGGRP